MFGKRLRELRDTKGLSMDSMVEKYNSKYNAKMNKSTLSRYENGLQNPIYTVVKNLADFFDVPVDYLSGSDKDVNLTEKEQPVFELLLSEKQETAFRMLLKIADEKNLDRLIDFLQLLIKAENQ